MIKFILLAVLVSLSTITCLADEDHGSHADYLLFLLQHKIAINKLQEQWPKLDQQAKSNNFKKQSKHLNAALPKLKRYMSVPESRYPNLDMYAQSLESRSSVLSDYTDLLIQFHRQN